LSLAALLFSIPASAQTAKAPAKAAGVPRMADGHPDLQGVYDVATITPVERASGQKKVLTKEEALKLETAYAGQRERGDQPIDGNRTAPPKGGDGSRGAAGNVGGYNSGWLDPGARYTIVNGEVRSSIVVDPEDGRVPSMSAGARQRGRGAVVRP